jgi:site-specific DNA-methyltransferase (adenine-specific)/modification methylase
MIIEMKSGTLFQGDCLEVMDEIADQSIDMILCDLPYGTTVNPWDSVIPFDALWQQYKRIIKPNGVIALTSQGIFTASLIMSNPKDFKYKLVWVKNSSTGFLNAKKQPLRQHEDVCIFYKGTPTYNPVRWYSTPYAKKNNRTKEFRGCYNTVIRTDNGSDGERYPTDVVYCKSIHGGARVEEGSLHPTQKPVSLARDLIRTYTTEGDVVLDLGSGAGFDAFLAAKKVGKTSQSDDEKLHRISFLHTTVYQCRS